MIESITPNGIKFTDKDIVDPRDSAYYTEDKNFYKVHPFVLHDHGFVVAVVFASNLQDALDEAVDNDKLDSYLISENDLSDYEDEEGITYLGNASEPFDIETLSVEELDNVPFSWCAMYNAAVPHKTDELKSALRDAADLLEDGLDDLASYNQRSKRIEFITNLRKIAE